MRTDTTELPEIDSSRTHLDILKSALEMLETHQPIHKISYRGCDTGDSDCADCGFPLTGYVKPGLKHNTYLNRYTKQPCNWLRSVAELQAWIRVEESIECK